MRQEILRLDRVTYKVGDITLLDNVSLHISKGEILGLLCLDAHGQDALIRLIGQNSPIHYGFVYFLGQLVNNYQHSSPESNRVAVIENPSHLSEALTVADNIFVLRRGFKKYIINPKQLEAQLERFTKELDIGVDANCLICQLSFFEKCVVELLKAVITGAKLIIFRDISNFVSADDLEKIHYMIRHYAAQGISFLYVCNHHEEAFTICERIALMDDGRILKILDKKNFIHDTVMHYALDLTPAGFTVATGDRDSGYLRFENVCTEHISNLNFTLEKGECVVFHDRSNTVLDDLTGMLTGQYPSYTGHIYLDGIQQNHKKYCDSMRDICFIAQNPTKSMLFEGMSYLENLCFLLEHKQGFLWKGKRIRRSVIREYEPLAGTDIYEKDITQLSTYSRYNIVYLRLHLYNPKIVFCMQPFAGADMYLRHHILQLIRLLRSRGITVVLLAVGISDCLIEADRLLIIEQGKLCKEYRKEEFELFRH